MRPTHRSLLFPAIPIEDHTVQWSKASSDRVTALPAFARPERRVPFERICRQHDGYLTQTPGFVERPGALVRKLATTTKEWPWQSLLRATRHYLDR